MATATTSRLYPEEFERTDGAEQGVVSDPRRVEVHDRVYIENVCTGLPELYTTVPPPLPRNADETWIDEESPLGSALIGAKAGEEVAFPALGVVFRYRVIEIMTPPRLRPVGASGGRRMERAETGP